MPQFLRWLGASVVVPEQCRSELVSVTDARSPRRGCCSARASQVTNLVDLAPGGRRYAPGMGRDGLLIGEVAARSGVSRKALRLYEGAGILPAPRRTSSGYRVYGQETLALLVFVTQARRLGFRLDEIKEIVGLKRSGRTPCKHVLELVHVKLAGIERALTDLAEVRGQLRGLLRSWQSRRNRPAAVCPCIEHLTAVKGGR